MRAIRLPRGALGVAALCLVAAACATPRQEEPRDVRVVDLSDEAADKIAERVAAYIPKQPTTAPQAVRIQAVAPRPGTALRPSTGPAVETTPQPPPAIFSGIPPVAAERVRAAAEKAVDEALRWLCGHQSENGSWPAAGFGESCPVDSCGGPGNPSYTPGVTGLALLSFLGDGHVPTGDSQYAETVQNGLRYLRTIQDTEGCFGPRTSQHFQYNHALASLAMVEAYGLSRSPILRESAQSAVNFVLHSRNPYMGWRYGVRDGDNDTSMTCWMVMVLASAKNAGLTVDDGAFRGALSWVDKMTDPELGRVGYNRRGGPTARTMEAMDRFPADRSEAMTAAGVLIRLLAGQSAQANEPIQKGADLIAAKPPVWDVDAGTNDFYYWQLGTQALRRVGGPRWDAWCSGLHAAVSERQVHGEGHGAGSWDPVDAWSEDGGRVYATATLCLALEAVQNAPR